MSVSDPLTQVPPTPVDYMSATAEILAAIAWPIVVLALLLIFRRPILVALRGLVKFKWGSAELEFDRELGNLAVSVAESKTPQERVAIDAPTLRESLGELDPRSAIIRGYVAIEQWAVDNFPEHGIEARSDHRMRPLMDMIREAVQKGLLPATMISQVQGLQTLRNLAAHAPTDPTPEQASEFLTLADAVLYLMRTGLE